MKRIKAEVTLFLSKVLFSCCLSVSFFFFSFLDFNLMLLEAFRLIDDGVDDFLFQVTNTPWGERVTFVFNPNSDLVAKSLHVSPFMVCLRN